MRAESPNAPKNDRSKRVFSRDSMISRIKSGIRSSFSEEVS